MKKYILVFAIFISQGVKSQAYQPFDSTTVWNTLRTGVGSTCYPDSLYSYFIKGYEINNGYTWYKVYANIYQFKSVYAPLYSTTCTPLSNIVTTSFMGLLNNDSINKKVYFVQSAILNQNFVPGNSCLEFDFNKSIGDTMWYYNSGVKVSFISYRITGIDSILFDGKYHKRFKGLNTDHYSYAPPDAYFIEGIGATGGIFNTVCIPFLEKVTPLLCFSGVNTSIYILRTDVPLANPDGMRDTISCGWVFTTSLPPLSFQDAGIKIYPNPCDRQFNISIENPGQDQLEVSISDIASRPLKIFSIDSWMKEKAIGLEDFSCGVYILKVIRNKEIIYTAKLIKQ